MKRLLIIAIAMALTLGLGLTAYAEMKLNFKGSDIIGAKVENRQGENLGEISDLSVDPKTGRVDFAVVSHGGVLGIGDKYVAVPLNAFAVKTDKDGKFDRLVLNMSKDKLAKAPNFDKDRWPDRPEVEKIYVYFGQTPYWSEDPKTFTEMKNNFKGSDIIGAKVENRQGENLGQISDLSVDRKAERVDFAILSHGGVLGIGDKYVAVPLSAFAVKTDKDGKFDRLVLNMSKDKLAKAPNFDQDRWPDRPEVERMYVYFGQTPYWRSEHPKTSEMKNNFKGSDLIGAKVENRQGEDLGKIGDLAVDPKTGRVDFAVLSHGGVLGIGDKYVAIPLSALVIKTDKNGKFDRLVLNMGKDKLAKAPNFDKDRWPDRREAERTYRYFGQTPYWSEHPRIK